MAKRKMSNIGDDIFIDTVYRPSAGSFGKPKCMVDNRYVVTNWYNCREIWHNQMSNAKIFFYVHPISTIKSFGAFFSKSEDRLGIEERSSFGPTQRKYIMYVRPGKWWLRYGMRRSLFTILLRSASAYDAASDNYETALYSNFYASKTRRAIEHFFAGNTVYKGKKRGWYRQFGESLVDEQALSKMLVPELKVPGN